MSQPYLKYGDWWVNTPNGSIRFPTDLEAWEYIDEHRT